MKFHLPSRLAAPALLLALAACGGGAKSEAGVREGFANAKKLFEDANSNTTWQGELDAMVSANAPIAPWVANHMPLDAKFKNFQDKSCKESWCVAIKPVGGGQFTIEAYGEDLARPVANETVKAY